MGLPRPLHGRSHRSGRTAVVRITCKRQDAEAYSRVMALRLRRVTSTVVLGATFALGLVTCSSPEAAASKASLGRGASTSITSTTATTRAVPGSCEGRLVSSAGLSAMTFLADSVGLGALPAADGSCGRRLVTTFDGGRTWRITGTPLPLAVDDLGYVPTGPTMIFPTRDIGWVYADGALVETRDGGSSWSVVRFCAPVEGVDRFGPSLWAVVAPCKGALGHYDIESATTTSRWHVVGSLVSASEPESSALVARLDAKDALVDLNFPSVGGLALTRDGARSWVSVDPCRAWAYWPIALDVESARVVWLMCEGPQITVAEHYSLLRSSDGGAHWYPVGMSVSLVRPFSTLLPGDFFVALAGVTSRELWLATRSFVFESRDGGKRWDVVSPKLGGVASAPFVFVDPSHGWLLAPGVGLWQTTNGRSWHLLR